MTIMPQCHIRGVRSVELVATNFEEASRFYQDVWDLQPVESRDGTRLFRRVARMSEATSGILDAWRKRPACRSAHAGYDRAGAGTKYRSRRA